jgi:hypothetical protein
MFIECHFEEELQLNKRAKTDTVDGQMLRVFSKEASLVTII